MLRTHQNTKINYTQITLSANVLFVSLPLRRMVKENMQKLYFPRSKTWQSEVHAAYLERLNPSNMQNS